MKTPSVPSLPVNVLYVFYEDSKRDPSLPVNVILFSISLCSATWSLHVMVLGVQCARKEQSLLFDLI